MKTLCIIPARSGSKGVPGKNTKLLNGRPLISYTYTAALESKLIDKIILSTDSEDIAATANSLPIEVPFVRPIHLAADSSPTADVIKHALDFFDSRGQHYDTICLLQPTCPFRKNGFVDKCIRTFHASGADCLFSVKKVPHEYNPHWVFMPAANGMLQVATGDKKIIANRQSLPQAYIRDGSVYVLKADNIRHYNSIYGNSISYVESYTADHVNIDTTDDWKEAERIAKFWMAESILG